MASDSAAAKGSSECVDGTCPLPARSGGESSGSGAIRRGGGSCLPCSGYKRHATIGGGRITDGGSTRETKRAKVSGGSSGGTIRDGGSSPMGQFVTPRTPPTPFPHGEVTPVRTPENPAVRGSVVPAMRVPSSIPAPRMGGGESTVTAGRKPAISVTDGGGTLRVNRPTVGKDTAQPRSSFTPVIGNQTASMMSPPSVTLSVPPTIARGSSPSINLPTTLRAPAPTSTVVTPKQSTPTTFPVLTPMAPLQPPPPDYCADPRFAGTELCRRDGSGSFPAVSDACMTIIRRRLDAGESAAQIAQAGDELCPDAARLLRTAVTIGTPPAPPKGAPSSALAVDAKGMPLDVPGAVKVVAPGGAPVGVSGEACLRAFLRLPPPVQQRIVGLFLASPQARNTHRELAAGVLDAAPTFVSWFRNAFPTSSPEASRFCAAVLSASSGVAPAGAPGVYVNGPAYVQPAGYARGASRTTRAGGYPEGIAIPRAAHRVSSAGIAVRPAGVPTCPFGAVPGPDGLCPGGTPPVDVPAPAAQGDGLSTQQILGGLGQVGQTGLNFLNQYLDRDSREHIAELQANAASQNERIRQESLQEIERIRGETAFRIAQLGPNATPQQLQSAVNQSVSGSPQQSSGVSTGTVVAVGGGVAAVGLIAYLATRKRR